MQYSNTGFKRDSSSGQFLIIWTSFSPNWSISSHKASTGEKPLSISKGWGSNEVAWDNFQQRFFFILHARTVARTYPLSSGSDAFLLVYSLKLKKNLDISIPPGTASDKVHLLRKQVPELFSSNCFPLAWQFVWSQAGQFAGTAIYCVLFRM